MSETQRKRDKEKVFLNLKSAEMDDKGGRRNGTRLQSGWRA